MTLVRQPSASWRLGRWKRRSLLVCGLTVVPWLFVSWLAADQMTRRASAIHPEPVPSVPWGTPQEIRLTTVDGEELGAWFFPGRTDRVAVVLLHGNGATRSACLDQAEWLVAANHPVMMVTLRAHGDSTGDRNDFGYSARHDVVAAVEWLEKNNCPRPVLWGRSLGQLLRYSPPANCEVVPAGTFSNVPTRI